MGIKKKNKRSLGMVDVSNKKVTKRKAMAYARVQMSPESLKVLLKDGSPKGNVLETAKVAGIMAAKMTPSIIPLCHPLKLSKVNVRCDADTAASSVHIVSEVLCDGKTGVEMEALTAVSVAALTIYDMMKWKDKGMVISDVKLIYKSGGKGGIYQRRKDL